MGKTRLEELFYELYASSKRHDSWQRHAMIVELRNLLKQPLSMKMRGGGSVVFEESGKDRRFGVGQFREGADDDEEQYPVMDDDEEQYLVMDEELAEIEAETKSNGIEDRAVENEANSKVISAIVKEESIPQFLMVTEADSTCVQHTNDILQQVSISPLEHSLNFCKANLAVMGNCQYAMGKTHQIWSDSNFGCVNDDACQVFDEIPLRKRILPKEHKKRFQKCWRFKFKDTAQPRGLIQEKLCVHEANETMNQLMLPMHLGRHILHQQLEIILCEYKNQILQLSNHDLETQMLPCLQRFSGVRMGIHVVFCLQELKPIWWVGYNEAVGVTSTKQEFSYWSVANHVKRDAQESFGSNGLAYDGCVILETNFAGFGRGKAELLATSQKMQRIDFFSFCCSCTNQILVVIHTEIEENLEFKQLLAAMERFSREVIEELAKRMVIEQEIEGGLICGDVKFHLKHKWRFRLLQPISRLILLALINLWFSKAYSSNGGAESFPTLNFATEQPLLWLQKNSEPILIISELERKKQMIGYKTRMFKYKAPLRRRQFLHHLDNESFQIKHKWRFKLLPLILECELYSYRVVLVTNYAQQFDISVFFSTNLEVKVSSKEGDLI